MKRRRLTFRIVFFFLVGTIVVLAIGSVWLSKLALDRVQSKLNKAGITTRSLQIDLLTQSVTLHGLEWQASFAADSGQIQGDSTSIHLTAETVRASGINIVSLIRHKQLRLGTFTISKGDLVVQFPSTANKKKLKKDKASKPDLSPDKHDASGGRELPLRALSLDRLALQDISFAIHRDSTIEHQGTLDLELRDIDLQDFSRFRDPVAYALGGFELKVDHYVMATKQSMYTLKLAHLSVDSKAKDVVADSIVLLPKYGKYQFSRRVGKQIDRFVLRVPKVTLAGLNFDRIKDSVFVASGLRIDRANLYVFRDKRLPFIKHNNTPLPVALVRSLPFGFAIDSLRIADTKITYEEFPEKGFKTGYIVFSDLNANLKQITNRNFYPERKNAVLHVTSHVMSHGMIAVDFTLPYDKPQIYNAKGRISNLQLSRLNPLLETLAYVRIESGRLNALDFDFDYDDYTSNGNIVLNYENLKLTGLKKEDGTKENDLKSFALGLFVKKDKDREVPLEKRSGKIYYERDRRRAIFNVWVRSLMSGVKSSVVDPPAERKPLTHKERRDSIRHERKEKKEQKKIEKQMKKEKRSAQKDTAQVLPVTAL